MKKVAFIVFGIAGAAILAIIILLCFSGMYGLDFVAPMISTVSTIVSLIFLSIITYCVIGIYINSKKQ